MTTNELIKKLFIAFTKNDEEEFYKLGEELINLEKRKKHNLVAKELKEALYSKSHSRINSNKRFKTNMPIPRDNDTGFPLLEIKQYELDWKQLILTDKTNYALKQIVLGFKSYEVLATYNLKPKNKVLFCGMPGTGKTFSAQVISAYLGLPLVYINFDAIISSYLGETASNLKRVFEFITNGIWVVLFDEVDIIGKNRDDQHETGEIKRVVNNFLQMIDNFEGDSLILASTNHPHILDPAIWRRFDEVINFELPDQSERLSLIKLYLKPIKKGKDININFISERTEGFSPSDLKSMCRDAITHAIINERDSISNNDLIYSLDRFRERLDLRTNS
ncbi:AAA family ATPase [Saliterribacillus persicus]|uniref:ATPase family protein associated with various cellular activities (AAA) n=1 Tax=Saliterribacillus persicus TaxID=930114 RepID=A0A368X4C0_9BACI|nr:ATP-binding protein [Saliterribacillus persicus]RCW62872.1 ATPase family protein associated with various cellular activities (AAA) [Saliterribacillus persicus]